MRPHNICETCTPWCARTPEELLERDRNLMLCEEAAIIQPCRDCQSLDWATTDAKVVQTPSWEGYEPIRRVSMVPLELSLVVAAGVALWALFARSPH